MSTHSDFLECIEKLETMHKLEIEYGKFVEEKLTGKHVIVDPMLFEFNSYKHMADAEKYIFSGFSGSYRHCEITCIKDMITQKEIIPIELIKFKE